MASLAELARQHTNLDKEAIAHLQRLVAGWGLLADFCFADLLLFAPVESPLASDLAPAQDAFVIGTRPRESFWRKWRPAARTPPHAVLVRKEIFISPPHSRGSMNPRLKKPHSRARFFVIRNVLHRKTWR